jgi:hypothetical protein
MKLRTGLLVGFLALTTGCHGRPRFNAPPIDPAAAAEHAFADYDRNHDGLLDEQELERCPALVSDLDDVDSDHDGRLSRAELQETLTACRDGGIGLMEVTCTVTLDGLPLSGAKVVMEPEPFLGSAVKPAQGKTDENGRTRFQVEGISMPGCQVGFYRVRITKTDEAGQELIPARYNQDSQLGKAVIPRGRGSSLFHLSSQ